MRYACITDISFYDLTSYSLSQLRQLAERIAAGHKKHTDSCTLDETTRHLSGVLDFGVTLQQYKSATIESLRRRVSDPDFWQRSLSHIARRTRETIAVANREVGPNEPYCSEASFQDFLHRQSARSCATIESLRRQAERMATQPYLITKAASERAFESGYLSVFITLVLDAPYRSSSPFYQYKDFDSGYRVLSSMQSSLLEHMSSRGKRGIDFYGVRCVEVHLDGSPHFHTLLFIRPDLLQSLKQKLKALHHSHSIEMGKNYDENEDEIVKVRSVTQDRPYQEAVSYIFKNSYAGRGGDKQAFYRALRQKTVISIYGKHQYELIGMAGSPTIIKELPRHRTVKQIAETLSCTQKNDDPRKNWLKIIKNLISGGHKKFRTITSLRKNRYGEEVRKTVGLASNDVIENSWREFQNHLPHVVMRNCYLKHIGIPNDKIRSIAGQLYKAMRLIRNRSPPRKT